MAEPIMENIQKKMAGRPKRVRIDDPVEEKADPAAVKAELMRQMDALIDIDFVSTITTLSTREINRRAADGRFPKPLSIGAMRKAWSISSVQNWILNPT